MSGSKCLVTEVKNTCAAERANALNMWPLADWFLYKCSKGSSHHRLPGNLAQRRDPTQCPFPSRVPYRLASEITTLSVSTRWIRLQMSTANGRGYPSGSQLLGRFRVPQTHHLLVCCLTIITSIGILYRRILIELQLKFDRKTKNGLHLPQAPGALQCQQNLLGFQ